ncbi:MAG TPA: efflux transporter outer membrane subunit [Pirellulales bacterium]|nr:efflux transporter outer membrane subunit [Pirellulales bacterium]
MIAWLVLAASSGCTTFKEYVHNGFKVGPNYQRPAAPVAAEWIDENDQRIRKQEDDLSHWWTVLDDPALDALVADAYRQNLTLRDAGFRVLQARAMLGISIGNFFPQTQNVSGDSFRAAYSQKAANRSYLSQRFFNQRDLGFNLAWELDFWGRFRRAIEAADANLNASVENYDDVLVTLLGDVATAYVNIRVYEQQIMLTRANVVLQTETLKLVKARFEGGQVSELDVDQAQSLLSQTEAEIPVLEISLRTANNQLCVLMGRPTVNLEPGIGPANIPTAPTDVVVGIPADLLRRRPDVRRAERLAAAQAAQIGVAVSDWYPHISILGTLDYQAQDFQHLFSGHAIQGDVGPSFQWNVLNYGRILNNVRLTDATFQQLVVDYQNTVLVAQQETENGLVTFLKSQEQTKDLAESVVAAQKAVVVALAQYKAGMIDFNRVSLLEQNLVTYQNQLAQARGSIALGLIETYRALGGGWTARLDANLENAPGLENYATRPPGAPEPVGVPGPVPLLSPELQPQPLAPDKSSLNTPPTTPADQRFTSTFDTGMPTANPTKAATGELPAPSSPLSKFGQLLERAGMIPTGSTLKQNVAPSATTVAIPKRMPSAAGPSTTPFGGPMLMVPAATPGAVPAAAPGSTPASMPIERLPSSTSADPQTAPAVPTTSQNTTSIPDRTQSLCRQPAIQSARGQA